jgi:hypothetical protein
MKNEIIIHFYEMNNDNANEMRVVGNTTSVYPTAPPAEYTSVPLYNDFSVSSDNYIGGPIMYPTCGICLEEIDIDLLGNSSVAVTTTSCDHQYHRHCLNEWLMNHNTCPTCRNELQLQHPLVDNDEYPMSFNDPETYYWHSGTNLRCFIIYPCIARYLYLCFNIIVIAMVICFDYLMYTQYYDPTNVILNIMILVLSIFTCITCGFISLCIIFSCRVSNCQIHRIDYSENE